MSNSAMNFTGPVFIVTDLLFRHPLEIGTGSFQMAADSSIFGGRIEIWTARQQFNSILGTLNLQRFIPGPLYQNSSQEYWDTFFPEHPLSGIPFAIYYKDSQGSIVLALRLSGQSPFIAIAEMLRYFHPYDEYLVLAEHFETVYDQGRKSPKEGMLTSFEAGEDRRFFIRRPTFYDDRVPLIPPLRNFFEIPKETL